METTTDTELRARMAELATWLDQKGAEYLARITDPDPSRLAPYLEGRGSAFCQAAEFIRGELAR